MKDLLDFITEYSVILGGTHIDVINLIWIFLLSIIIFLAYGVSSYNANKESLKEDQYKSLKVYYFERAFFCILSTIIISYTVIVLCGNEINIGLNYIIIPFCGILATFYLNSYFLGKGWTMQKYPKNEKEASSKEAVSVIINNTIDNDNTAAENTFDEITDQDLQEKGVSWFLNILNKNHYEVEQRLDKNEAEMIKQSSMMEAMHKAMIEDRAQEIEILIYAAFEKGHTDKDTDRIIRNKYYIYHDILHGNGRIKTLFEKYEQLHIYND